MLGSFKVQEVEEVGEFKGSGIQWFVVSWFWCQNELFFSSEELRSTKACALPCIVFVCVGFCICSVSGSVMPAIHALQGMFDVCVV